MASSESSMNATSLPLHIVVLGLSITSSWRNAHAGLYRALLGELRALGHDVLFLQRQIWGASMDNLARPQYCRVVNYDSPRDLRRRFSDEVRNADVVIVGSFVPDGVEIGEWVTATARGVTVFYDIDAPVTMGGLQRGDCPYLAAHLVPRYQLYLTSAGTTSHSALASVFGATAVRTLYPALTADSFAAALCRPAFDLGCMSVNADPGDAAVRHLLYDVARRWPGGRFVTAGPDDADPDAPPNIDRAGELQPSAHRAFFRNQRFTLQPARSGVTAQLLAAAAAGSVIITDDVGAVADVLRIGTEVIVARRARDIVDILVDMPESQRRSIAAAARGRVLRDHNAPRRARELLAHIVSVSGVVSAA
jgi:spore maturation protein CgeB